MDKLPNLFSSRAARLYTCNHKNTLKGLSAQEAKSRQHSPGVDGGDISLTETVETEDVPAG